MAWRPQRIFEHGTKSKTRFYFTMLPLRAKYQKAWGIFVRSPWLASMFYVLCSTMPWIEFGSLNFKSLRVFLFSFSPLIWSSETFLSLALANVWPIRRAFDRFRSHFHLTPNFCSTVNKLGHSHSFTRISPATDRDGVTGPALKKREKTFGRKNKERKTFFSLSSICECPSEVE